MARIPRRLNVLPNYSVHKTWRGHNKEFNLGTDYEKLSYLEFLNDDLESKKFESGADLNALTLMSNHAHEMFKVLMPRLFSEHMRRHHSRYGSFFNKLKNRCGKVAQGRPHTTLIGDWQHEIHATCYIHANPVRAKIVKDAANYRWSTHRLYAFGKREPWMRNIKLPEWYKSLGKTPAERQRKYRQIFVRYLKEVGLVSTKIFKRPFFGPVAWTLARQTDLRVWRKAHSPPS